MTREGGDDPVVRDEVLALLEADRDDAFLERGAHVQPADLLDEAGGHAYEPGASLGPYRIERLLARGGMGSSTSASTRVSAAGNAEGLPAATARDPRARARLQREARTAAQLRHPHIVSVHALEELGDTLVIVPSTSKGRRWPKCSAIMGPSIESAGTRLPEPWPRRWSPPMPRT